MSAPERLLVGRIIKPHGIRGEVVVHPESDRPERFAEGSVLLLDEADVVIEAARPHQGRLLVKFEHVHDRNGAEALRGAELTIPATEAAPLEEGSYYPHQLVGARVEDEDGQTLGTLTRVDENPANDLWVVDTGAGEVLVPAVREIVVAVDVDAGRIVVSPPEGMFDGADRRHHDLP